MTLLGEAPPRRSLADQLFHRVLRSSGHPDVGDPLDAVAPGRLGQAAGARTALREAADVVQARRPGTIYLAAGDRGLVLLMHGPTWSLLAPATATACPLVVCAAHDRLRNAKRPTLFLGARTGHTLSGGATPRAGQSVMRRR